MILSCGDLSEENFLVLQRILNNLWKMTGHVDKIFGFQMTLFMCNLLFMLIFTQYFFLINMTNDQSIMIPIAYFGVLFCGIGALALSCSVCTEKVRSIIVMDFGAVVLI